MQGARLVDELIKLLGQGGVTTTLQDVVSYSSDMFPRNQIRKLGHKLPDTRPLAICFPESTEDVARIMLLCNRERVPVIPYGAGSGVCGATVPEEQAIIMDVKKMNAILEFSEDGRRVVTQPGLIGEQLEERLNARGLTLGHFPSSIACSTVGGYVACRSAGQYSSRYGKVEDFTLGLEVVRADGSIATFGVLGGGHHKDPMLAVIIGCEGTLGVITRICLRVEPLPKVLDFRGYAFLDLEQGVKCMQRVMRSGLRPTVLRLYDPLDSLIGGYYSKTTGGEDIHRAAAKLTGIRKTIAGFVTDFEEAGMAAVLYKPAMLNRFAEILPTRSILIVGVQGSKSQVTQQWDDVGRLVAAVRGEDLGSGPGYKWFKKRYAVSYKQSKVFAAGAFVDTMEVATTWENVLPLYKAVCKAMGKHVFVMAHFSHAYAEGCSIYFSFAGYRPTARAAAATYQRAWRSGLDTVIRHGATISHHHGIGILKRWAMTKEAPGGRELFAAFKKVLDPEGIMNSGKLYNVD